MAHSGSEVGEMQPNGVSEVMDLLQIDVETDVVEERPGRGDTTCSVSLFSFEIHFKAANIIITFTI